VRLGEHRWLLESEYTSEQGRAQRALYVLDAEAASLSEPLSVDHLRGAPFELWRRPIVSAGTLLDVRLDPGAFSIGGRPPATSSAFYLERYTVNSNAGLDALPAVQIPGYPIALLEDGDLLTAQPEAALKGTAKLHRVRLSENRGVVTATRAVQARYGDAEVVGQSLVYVRQAADPCDPVTHIETFALDAALTPRGSLELPGVAWSVVGVGGSDLVLEHSDRRSFARIAIDASGVATVAAFETAPSVVEAARVDDAGLQAIAGGEALRLLP
jgi:hypothetical protein